MPTPIEVRRAGPDELDAAGELTARVYVDEGWASEQYAPVVRDARGRAATADVLVALDGGAVVGAVTLASRGGPYAEQAGPGEAVMRMLVTDPAVRGRGVGTALVDACLQAAVGAGCARLLLSTQAQMAAAHRLYERAGFVRTPERDWRPEPDLLLLTYARDLP